MSDELRFEGRAAAVTGAGRGIGRAIALHLAERGAKVVVNDNGCAREGAGASQEPAIAVSEEILKAGGTATPNFADVSTPAGADWLVSQALQEFGRLDIVVNNAGIIYRQRPFIETTFESIERQWRVHFGGTYNVTRAAWPHMAARGYGRIVNICSSAGFYGQPLSPEYSAAKGAVHAFTYSLAHESPDAGILVNGVGPAGYTRMVTDLFPDDASAAGPKRFFQPEFCAPAVAWLAHESCESNGKIYQAHAARVACVAITEPVGYWNWDLTPEAIRDNLDEVCSREELQFPNDAMTWAGWVMENSAQRYGW